MDGGGRGGLLVYSPCKNGTSCSMYSSKASFLSRSMFPPGFHQRRLNFHCQRPSTAELMMVSEARSLPAGVVSGSHDCAISWSTLGLRFVGVLMSIVYFLGRLGHVQRTCVNCRAHFGLYCTSLRVLHTPDALIFHGVYIITYF
jgi:hypothetical protein